VVNGLVDARFTPGPDTFQLGGTGSGTFNVSNIGPNAQYRGFEIFNKIGSSNWTLTGSGAQNWTISSGTLIGDTNSLGGPAITNNAALVFNQAFNGTYAGVISGTGSVTKDGISTVTFSGDNTFSGATTISGGALVVNGSNRNSAVTVGSGTTLSGIGTVGTTVVTAGGTLSPGSSIGTLTVNGNLTFNPGSIYRVEV